MIFIFTVLEWFFIGKIFGTLSKYFDKIFYTVFHPSKMIKKIQKSFKQKFAYKKPLKIPEPNMYELITHSERHINNSGDMFTVTTVNNSMGVDFEEAIPNNPQLAPMLYGYNITPVTYKNNIEDLRERVLSKIDMIIIKK